MKDKSKIFLNESKYALDALVAIVNEYHKIGTPAECKAARDKQRPMLVKEIHVDEYICPACGQENGTSDDLYVGENYCPKCGKRVIVKQKK